MDNQAYISDKLDDTERFERNGVTKINEATNKEPVSSSTCSKSTLAQFTATFVNSLSSVSLGLLYMISATVIKNVYNAETGLSLNDEQVSWYASLLPIVQPIGCFLGGYMQRYIGRVHGLMLMNVSSIISWTVLFTAGNAKMLYIASILMGLSIGFTEAPCIVYIAEIATPSLRGIFVSYYTCNSTFGIALNFFLSQFVFWRTLCILGICLSVVTIFLLFLIPDSPTWLLNRGKEKEALKALCWLRGWVSEEEVKEEFESLRQQIKNSIVQDTVGENGEPYSRHRVKANELIKAPTLRPLVFVTVYYFFSCSAMVVGARNYALLICSRLNLPVSPISLVTFSWIAAIVGNIMCSFLLKIFGKRPMSLLSMLLSSSICLLIGLYITFQYELNQPMMFVAMFVCHGFTNYLGISALPWMLVGEIYPLKTRSLAAGITGAIFFITVFAHVKTFYYLELLLTTQGIYVFYGILGLIGFFYLWMFMPETEGKTMIEIEELFADQSRKKCSHFRRKK